jgi:hypothetical protein
MRITSGGNVGIGTSSPTTRLDIDNGTLTLPTLRGRTYQLSNVASANPNFIIGTGFNSIPVRVGDTIDLPFDQTRTVTAVTDTQITVNAAWTVSFAGSNVEGRGCLVFQANNAERMRITSGGNVGIGTDNPSQKLEVVGGEIKAGRVDSTNEGGQVSFGRASDNATGWYIDAFGNTSTPALRFVDVSNSAVRMTLTGGGNVQINTTNSPLARLHVADGLNSTMLLLRSNNDTATSIGFTSTSPGGSTDNYSISHTIVHGGSGGYQIEHNATLRWIRMIAGSGGVELAGTAGSWATISDIRTKDVLQTGISNAIDKIKNLDAIFYKYKNEELLQEGETMPELVEKDKPTKIKQRRVGLIAQQIQEVLPEAVTYNEEEDTYRLSYTEVIPLLVESIKEQQTQIESLKAEIQTLKQ